MKRLLIIAIVVLNCLMLIQAALLRAERAERRRIQTNNEVLTDSVEFYRTASGKHAASRQVLELRASEMERYNAQLAAQVRELRIKVRRLEAAATTATRTEVQITAPLEPVGRKPSAWEKYGAGVRRAADSVKAALDWRYSGLPKIPEAKVFRWADQHVSVDGIIRDDSVSCHVTSIDTLQQIVHRVPRRFLFIRWGTKAIRQEVVSSNPHTRITYTEYIELKGRNRK
jgi:hypothetical protein